MAQYPGWNKTHASTNIEGICQLNQALRNGAKVEDLMANNESKRYA
jgi:hypothetical protein